MLDLLPMIPESAPFNSAQRSWLNGWLAAYYGAGRPIAAMPVEVPAEEELPWHDMSLPLEERLQLAAGRPLGQQLMAAMAQQDCGQCGYLCKTYAEAVSTGAEKSLTRCVPGGKATARALTEILELAPTVASIPASVTAAQVAPIAPGPATARALARLEACLPLNREGSLKDTRHVVFDLAGTGLTYDVGDALGVQPENCPDMAAAIIGCLGADLHDEVDCPDGSRRGLFEALVQVCDIARPSDEAIEVLASRAPNADESQRLQALAEGYPGAGPEEADLLDLLLTFRSARPPVQELISALGILQPRLYSISSSSKMVGEAVHLTVAAVRYQRRGRQRKGVASTYLAERTATGGSVPVFVQPTHDFRLPADDGADVIMIGPGTGVAPFRAFLQERRARGARGRNWLFFGDQRRACDFLYEEELTGFRRDGLLTELDLAFSRDQNERVYVQQRMRERAGELWAWIEGGAQVFVCGAVAMARDVDAALAAIIARQGVMGPGAAKAYLAKLTREKRYLKDVY